MNAIVYYLDNKRYIFPTEISSSTSQNIAIDIIEVVKGHSKSLPNGLRSNITFYDLSIRKQMTIPHMYPLEPGLSMVPISLEEERQIKEELSRYFLTI